MDANTMKVAFSCKGGQGEPPSSGEGAVTFQGPKAYSGQFKFKTVQQGKPRADRHGAKGPLAVGRLRRHRAHADRALSINPA